MLSYLCFPIVIDIGVRQDLIGNRFRFRATGHKTHGERLGVVAGVLLRCLLVDPLIEAVFPIVQSKLCPKARQTNKEGHGYPRKELVHFDRDIFFPKTHHKQGSLVGQYFSVADKHMAKNAYEISVLVF